ncbi:ABC transporter permease [Agromyces sp. NPDC058136]|uniref:ABC transporter permease n=1 Tax=Agromyces sp. NPDC058136 TaxID=3346354 RepID=UPI0036DC5F05
MGVGTLSALAIAAVASILVFGLVRSAPGDPVDLEFSASGASAYLNPEEDAELRQARRAELGLDKSVLEQYVLWVGRIASGDFGVSFRSGEPVLETIATRLPASMSLGACAMVLLVLMSVATAWLAVRWADGWIDQALRVLSIAAATVPTFLTATLALRWAAEALGYPVAGEADPTRIWLPAFVMALSGVPTMARVLRASLLEESSRPFAVAARARGARARTVLMRHTLRPALAPVVALTGLSAAALMGGAVITEVAFSWPGVGALAIDAIAAQDYPVVQAYVIVMVLLAILANRSVDVAQRLLDPRTRRTAA